MNSISVTVRVRPFTIREAAQLTKTDEHTLFLGDGSLAAAPTPKLNAKSVRPVIKVIDEKCLYENLVVLTRLVEANLSLGSSTPQKTTLFSDSHDHLSGHRVNASRIRPSHSTVCSTTQQRRAMSTKRQPSHCWTMCWTDTMPPSLHTERLAAERHIQSRTSYRGFYRSWKLTGG